MLIDLWEEYGGGNHCEFGDPLFETEHMTLIEPNPFVARRLRKKYPHATIHELAVVAGDTASARICLRGAQTHLEDVPDAPVLHKARRDAFSLEVPAASFDQIDSGDFDSVVLDMEGAEWFALQNMVSRPQLLIIETHSVVTSYRNPFIKEILQWVEDEGYSIVFRDESSSLFVKKQT